MIKLHFVKQLGLTALLLALVAVLESKSAIGAYNSVGDHVSGLQHAALSGVCAVLAFVFSAMAGAFKDDIRPHVARRTKWARVVSIAFLVFPIGYLGSSLKNDRIERQWATYYGSDAYRADVTLANDGMADRMDRADATVRITKPVTDLSITDGEFFIAAFLQVLMISAAGLRIPAPVTAEEVKHFRSVRAGLKGAATRRRKATAKANKPALRILAGGKL